MNPESVLAGKFLGTVREHELIVRGDKVLAGLSGGADSVALLHLLAVHAQELGIEVFACHVHHHLRGAEAERDADFAAGFAAGLGVPFERLDVYPASHAGRTGLSIEMAARELRYAAFESLASCLGVSKIATAHHRDDALETVMLRLFKGCGTGALASIPLSRGRIVRPLLTASKAEILDYLRARGLDYVTDSTNAGNDAERNFIRNEILPRVLERFPAAAEKIAELSAIVREEETVWSGLTEGLPCREEDGAVTFPPELFERPLPVVRRFVRERIAVRVSADFFPNRALFERMEEARKKPGSREIYSDGAVRLLAERGSLRVERVSKNFMKSPQYVKLCTDLSASFGGSVYTFVRGRYDGAKAEPGRFSFDPKGAGTAAVRGWEAGDRIVIGGGTKKLSDLFVDEKFTASEKRDAAVIEADGRLVAVTAKGRMPRVSKEFYARDGGDCMTVTVTSGNGE